MFAPYQVAITLFKKKKEQYISVYILAIQRGQGDQIGLIKEVGYFFNLFLFFETGLKDYLFIADYRKFTSKFLLPIWPHLLLPIPLQFLLLQCHQPLGCTWNMLAASLHWRSALALSSAWDALSPDFNTADFLPPEPVNSGTPTLTFSLRQITQIRKTTPSHPSCFFPPLSRTSVSLMWFYFFIVFITSSIQFLLFL